MQNLIEIHVITYNEEIMLPFTITHYRKMFDNPKFIIHDNGSTDDTLMLAKLAGCEIIPFITEGMNDTIQSKIKSEAAMNAKSKWVLCIDCDEECMINSKDLTELESRGINVVEFQGWDIFDNQDSPSKAALNPRGCQSPGYSKPVLLRTGCFSLIEYGEGAHRINQLVANTESKISWSNKEFNLFHYKHWSPIWHLNRSHELGKRQSTENIQRGHSTHFALPDTVHTDWFNTHYALSDYIKDSHI